MSIPMSDELNATELNRKLQERRAKFECPICNHERWGTDGERVTLPGLGAREAVALVCLNCGYVRWHVINVLEGKVSVEAGEAVESE